MKNARSGLALTILLFGIGGPTAYAATENDKITADVTTTNNAFFGISVAVSGTTVVVGALGNNLAGGANSGSAYVFDCSSFPCVQVSKLTASDAAEADHFGWSVAVSGTTAVVGAVGNRHRGAAYYFDLSTCGVACIETGKLTASDAVNFFGLDVAVSGTTAVVGVLRSFDAGINTGGAYYFDLSTCGAACTETGKLTASDAAAGEAFGVLVAVSGATAVVGATEKDNGTGAAYYFDLSTCGAACTETGKLTASDAAEGDGFGSVAVSGTTAVVGTGTLSGSYYFDLSTCGAACTETGKLTASDAADGVSFYFPVAVSGTTAVVSAFGEDGAGNLSESAYYFDLSTCGAACTETGKLTASDARSLDSFGTSVAVSEEIVVVGASHDDEDVTVDIDSGSAYVFELADPDDDGDGVPNDEDICPGGDDNVDTDGDAVPDFCDLCPFDDQNDADGDGVCGDVDTCPGFDDDVNADGDDLPDACDVCPFDASNDADADGLCADEDNCPAEYNPNQKDNDGDTVGDECDPDDDNDGVDDGEDNCPFDPNPGQEDSDGDGDGDVCDDDDDSDGVDDADDSCPGTDPGDVVSGNGCSIDQLCPCESPWKNHGAYVRCVAHTADVFVDLGLITETEKGVVVSEAAQSTCGHKNK